MVHIRDQTGWPLTFALYQEFKLNLTIFFEFPDYALPENDEIPKYYF